jgi:hypothetical protein
LDEFLVISYSLANQAVDIMQINACVFSGITQRPNTQRSGIMLWHCTPLGGAHANDSHAVFSVAG